MALLAANAQVIVKSTPFYEYSGIPAYQPVLPYSTYSPYYARLAHYEGLSIPYSSLPLPLALAGHNSPLIIDSKSKYALLDSNGH